MSIKVTDYVLLNVIEFLEMYIETAQEACCEFELIDLDGNLLDICELLEIKMEMREVAMEIDETPQVLPELSQQILAA